MTNHQSSEGRQFADRLREALAAPNDLNCDEARALLADMVAAEQAGVDVDADPIYAALLDHLDTCEECLALYEALSEGIASLKPTGEVIAAPPPTSVPTFFGRGRLVPKQSLRVLAGPRRQFALLIQLPKPLPLVGTLGGTPEATLFDEQLHEITGNPTLSLRVQALVPVALVQVTLHETRPQHWLVTLRAGSFSGATSTDEQGVATFHDVPIDDLVQVELVCAEQG